MSRFPRFLGLTGAVLVAASLVAATATSAPAATKTTKKTTKATKKTTKTVKTTKRATATTAKTGPPPTAASAAAAPATTTAPKLRSGTLRLGYFANVTHAPALVGVEKGIIPDALGPDVKLQLSTFNAGPAAVEALFSDALDATYIGPNPAINAFQRSNGKAVRIIAGSTSGGAFLVVKPSIRAVDDLKGKKLATPQLGGTQDVALRSWLKSKGLKTTIEGGGDVSIIPQENAQTLETFRSGQIDGAWVPEPWATRLILEGGAKVLVDERDLWPKQRFVTTVLLVRTKFLEDRPDIVERLLTGHVAAIEYLQANPAKAQALANDHIGKVTGRKLTEATITNAWVNLTFTNDPELESAKLSAQHAVEIGLLEKADLKGIDDLTLLNKVLSAAGKARIDG